MKQWFLYILECGDGSFYTGITTDVEKRIKKHNAGCGAKYTRGRGPVVLKYREAFDTESLARKREREIKDFSRENKSLLIKNAKYSRRRDIICSSLPKENSGNSER